MSEERKETKSMQATYVTESVKADTNNKAAKILGVVESCGQLRVRKEPTKESDVVTTIPVCRNIFLTFPILQTFQPIH